MKINPAIPILLATMLLAGCAAVPLPKAEGAVALLTPEEVLKNGQVGARVRWGGVIVQTSNEPERTCFEISSRPLDGEGEPLRTDQTFGRFMACAKGFYEPSLYAATRKLTVVGELAPAVKGKVGEHDYVYPMVKVEAMQLWPILLPSRPPVFFYDPFWDSPFYHPIRRR